MSSFSAHLRTLKQNEVNPFTARRLQANEWIYGNYISSWLQDIRVVCHRANPQKHHVYIVTTMCLWYLLISIG